MSHTDRPSIRYRAPASRRHQRGEAPMMFLVMVVVLIVAVAIGRSFVGETGNDAVADNNADTAASGSSGSEPAVVSEQATTTQPAADGTSTAVDAAPNGADTATTSEAATGTATPSPTATETAAAPAEVKPTEATPAAATVTVTEAVTTEAPVTATVADSSSATATVVTELPPRIDVTQAGTDQAANTVAAPQIPGQHGETADLAEPNPPAANMDWPFPFPPPPHYFWNRQPPTVNPYGGWPVYPYRAPYPYPAY
ncbi:MAG: hypothetical protein H6980_06660 [Gammaproteobacteria bacterium]|nr:hypothetical protein [Gammaproteobacteria bacterium]